MSDEERPAGGKVGPLARAADAGPGAASGAESSERDSLNGFVLRTRALAALGRAGIATIGQLRALSQRDWLEVCGLGVKSVAELARALEDPSLTGDDPLPLLALPRPLSSRDRDVLRMRASGATIAEIARSYGISRVRVQQLFARGAIETL